MDKKVDSNGTLHSEVKMETSVKLLSPNTDTSKEVSLALRISQTAVMYSAFFSLGIAGAIVGPTLLDLEMITRTDTETIAWVLTSRCMGGLVGVIIMGAILSRANPWLLMGLAHAVAAIMLAIAPLFKNIIVMCCIFVLHGVGRWFVDGACNVMVLAVWGAANGPWLQGLHCTTGIGALLAPMLAAPFLMEQRRKPQDLTNITSSSNITDVTPSPSPSPYPAIVKNTSDLDDNLSFRTRFSTDPSLRIFIAYSITGAILLISCISMFTLFCLRNRFPGIKRSSTYDELKDVKDTGLPVKKSPPSRSTRERIFHLQMIFLGALFDAVLCLVAVNYGNFVFSFAVKYLGWSNNAAVSVTSAYWGTFICARGMAVLISKVLKPGHFLLLCILLGLVSSVPLLFFVRSHPAVFWAGSIGFGLAVSPMFATSVSLMGCYIQVSGPEGAVLVTATLVGEMTGPVLVSVLFGQYGHISLIYLVVAVMLALLIISGLIYLVGRSRRGEHYESTVTTVSAEEKPLQEKCQSPDKV